MDRPPEEEEDPTHELSNIKNPNPPDDLSRSSSPSDEPPTGIEPLRISQWDIRLISPATEETLADIRTRDLDLSKALEDALQERNSLRVKLSEAKVFAEEREEADLKKRLDLTNELVVTGARVSELLEERNKRDKVSYEILDLMRSVKHCTRRICERVDDEKVEECVEEEHVLNEGVEVLLLEAKRVHMLGIYAETKIIKYEEMRRKEKKMLENSIVSLTEENRDIGSLLRIALAEKEAVEKNLSRLKGSGDQKRVAILQIAERGLQKVGFGFMMGASTGEPLSDNMSTSNSSMKSDGSECEEESISLASTIENIMKNLRLEIRELRQSLTESRSDCEQLQILADKQAQKITESTLYIQNLEERENMLAQNIEELIMEINETEEGVARWREACELEVEAGTTAIEEREKEAASLREELAMTKSDLDALNNKLGLKEKLASDAMAAQAAAETSLQLADSRSIGLRDRIEELTRQLEEEAERNARERHASRRRVRYICWPWHALRINPSNYNSSGPSRSVSRRMLPPMEALLH